MEIVFWQHMFSPHMLGLAEALAARGHLVTFVATEPLSQARREQGWEVSAPVAVNRKIIKDRIEAAAFISGLKPSTLHITQGIRGNAKIRIYQDQIATAGQRLWVIMETVDPGGWRAPFKNILYACEIKRRRKRIEGVLAIGAGTADWLVKRGIAGDRVHPFAYFITPPTTSDLAQVAMDERPFTFAIVGNLEPWKNPMLALEAFIRLSVGRRRLVVVGDGSLRPALEARAQHTQAEANIDFLGRLPMSDVPKVLAEVDCLLLASNVDGWGVVASEAMLVGTPTIVSDACGVRSAVQASPKGAVFPVGNLSALQAAMSSMQSAGRDMDRRAALKAWASPLGAAFGAEYLEQILSGSVQIALPAWLRRGSPLL